MSSKLSVLDRKLLVTTALESTWGNDECLLFAGEWCKLYDRRHAWQERSYETVPFHWDDREKLKNDYDYLEDLHHTLLHCLTDSLNSFHKVEYSLRSWQILLDPWLLSYVSVLFDRWETLRLVFEGNLSVETVLPTNMDLRESPFSYNEFISQVLSDEWNYLLFSCIIENHYRDKCIVYKKEIQLQSRGDEPLFSGQRHRRILEKLSISIDTFLGWFSSRYKIVFLSSGFNLSSLVKMSLAIRQVPRLFLKDFKLLDQSAEVNYDSLDRNRLSLQFEPKNEFEAFLKESILTDLPRSVVEGFASLRDRAETLKIKTKAVVTASDHWGNILSKFWFVEQVNKGVKLVILEHGGSFPAFKELFDFEEDIADVRGTWFLPYHDKHVKVPPTKLVGSSWYKNIFKKKPDRRFCSCIGNEQARWVYRAHYYPMSAQCLTSFNWSIVLYKALNEEVKKNFQVRPYPNIGWNTKAMYEDLLGADNISNDGRLDDFLMTSKVIICTYPETTFSEAMATGIPTILFYPEQFYERNPVTYELLDVMRVARLVFHNPEAVAEHINSIWDDPDKWWNTPDVLYARNEFTRQAISGQGNWLDEWKGFVGKVID